MLALTRKKDEAIVIDSKIEVKVLDIQGDKVRLGITAPKEVSVHREEVYVSIKASNEEATQANQESLNKLKILLNKK